MSYFRSFVVAKADQAAIESGRAILSSPGSVYRIIYDDKQGVAYYRVRGSDKKWHEVRLSGLSQQQHIKSKCTCSEYVPMCQHVVAALLHLEAEAQGLHVPHSVNNGARVVSPTGESELSMSYIELTTLMLNTSTNDWPVAKKLASTPGRVQILSAADFEVRAAVEMRHETYRVTIKKTDKQTFLTVCNCSDRLHKLCVHKAAVFLSILQERGERYFDYLKNWDKEKALLLADYGFEPTDDTSGLLDFVFNRGGIQIRVLDKGLRRLPERDDYRDLKLPARPSVESVMPKIKPKAGRGVALKSGEQRVCAYWYTNSKQAPGFGLGLFSAKFEEHSKMPVAGFQHVDLAARHPSRLGLKFDYELLKVVQVLDAENIRLLFLGRSNPGEETPEQKAAIDDYLGHHLEDVFAYLSQEPLLFVSDVYPAQQHQLQLAAVSTDKVDIVLTLREEGNLISFGPAYFLDGIELPEDDCVAISQYILRCGQVFYLFRHPEQGKRLDVFVNGRIKVHRQGASGFISSVVVPYRQYFKVVVPPAYDLPVRQAQMKPAIILAEHESYLLFRPLFVYDKHQVYHDGLTELVVEEAQGTVLLLRDSAAEQEFIEYLKSQHNSFSTQQSGDCFYLSSQELLHEGWFMHFMEVMKQADIDVLGYKSLRKFRYNTARLQTKISVGSGTDWFDIKLELSYGDQKVSLADVRKAVLANRDYVELSDGTIGVLPKEWLDQYGLLLKISDRKQDGIKLSKLHYHLVEDLYDLADQELLQRELSEKRERIKQFQRIKEIPLPTNIHAELRNYQKEGFNWLNFLHEFKWGGILADDMGLGKTLQALTFFQHLVNVEGPKRFLVVCPMSLIFNWENEIKKFTPGLDYYIHHGPARNKTKALLGKHTITLTSYGTVRSDIATFKDIYFDYVLLDESQAIKNPLSLSSKAVQLIKAGNRICMSGTPLQNNTLDLYAQLNFCNPGMLGSIEFFKEHFSIPIDKMQDPNASAQLKKLTMPFVLRRVKEEVAQDLPPRIESVLFCEMREEQRRIYEQIRNDIRNQLLSRIDSDGIAKSGLFILQGLTKLRQVCDSPAILNDETAYPNHSIKIEELSREIVENVSNHKVLVFSQFLGMLDLIRRKLNELGIKFAYFDGSTHLDQRQQAIDLFQSDPDCRVFLISLKAGGVGLNLTAADYVYIVDPWWNPAVEQQAIDRTHRIGQDKTIFAYRMICKDSVEEKIMDLQARKRFLADNLVNKEGDILNQLTRDDIVFLLS